MRRCFPILLAACGGPPAPAPTPPPQPPELVIAPLPAADAAPSVAPVERTLEPLRDAACAIRDANGKLVAELALTFHKKPFAVVRRLGDLEVRIAGDAATASFSDEDVVIVGEVSPAGLRVRPPRDPKSWLDVREGKSIAAAGASLTLDVELPRGLVPRTAPSFTWPCADVSLAQGPLTQMPAGKSMSVKAGMKATLRDASGAGVAELVAPPVGAKMEPVNVWVIERRGKEARVMLTSNDATAMGWMDASALEPPSWGVGYGTGRGNLASAAPLRCPDELPVFVRDGGEVVRVGVVRAKGAIRTAHVEGTPDDEMPIDLGAHGETALHPFVRAPKGCMRL
ncbi:MAG TPA: hypothetical protein VIF62_13980 [Labilithrix sp.]